MKKTLLLLFLISTLTCFSQVKKTSKKLVQIIEPRQIYINSATKVNGKTRLDIKIDLPINTVEWYYVFTTTANPATNSLSLYSQLSNLFDNTGFTSVALKSISVPDGFAPIDIFLTDSNGKKNFYKKDFLGAYEFSDPGSFPEGTAKNHRSGKVKIDDVLRGTYFLAIRNPSLNTGVNVMMEVVAIVEENDVNLDEWSKEQKESSYNYLIDHLSKNGITAKLGEEKANEFSTCIMNSMTSKYSPNDMIKFANYELNNILTKIIKDCDKEMKTNLFY